MTESDITALVLSEIKGLSTNFVTADYTNALSAATRETGFSVPNTNNTQIQWIVQRTKRHLFFMLATENSVKFKIKQINLDQKFKHLMDLIKIMDDEFIKVQEDPSYFLDSANNYDLFGHKIDAGFAYDPVTGEDTTYDSDNVVIITPGTTTSSVGEDI